MNELQTWSLDWLHQAGDGFKAEMIWHAMILGLPDNHLRGLSFEQPEWQTFAAYWLPGDYSVQPKRNADNAYEALQIEAVHALHQDNDAPPAIFDTDDTISLAVHRVVWQSLFAIYQTDLQLPALLTDDPALDDDTRAMIALARIINGEPVNVPMPQTEIEPLTYHSHLVAEIAQHLRSQL